MPFTPWGTDEAENQRLIDEVLAAPPAHPPIVQGALDPKDAGKWQAFSRNPDGTWNFGHAAVTKPAPAPAAVPAEPVPGPAQASETTPEPAPEPTAQPAP